jgi:lipoprotein NlpD
MALLPVFSACGARTLAPVQDRSAPVRQPEREFRDVQVGDTLYSIAWESGRDYRELAVWNRLDPPYLIRPGQRIRLYAPPANAQDTSSDPAYRIVAKGDTLHSIAKSAGVRDQDLAAWNSLDPPYTLSVGQRLRLSPPAAASTKTAKAPATVKRPRADADVGRAIEWNWPAEGPLIARFAPSDAAKGIDIGGAVGQTIRAAAGGSVVYQGSGLRGYGQLIIIKHNADFLSAYAHCAAIYVQEGSVIKSGQKIAAMGSSGTDRVKLHFEIRRRGTPVDPLDYLPKK